MHSTINESAKRVRGLFRYSDPEGTMLRRITLLHNQESVVFVNRVRSYSVAGIFNFQCLGWPE
jgi:hypothetical protein